MSDKRMVVLTHGQGLVLDQLVNDGAENKVIATRLGVTEDTVKSHMKAILTAFGASNRAAAAVEYLHGRVNVQVKDLRQRSAAAPVMHLGPAAGTVLRATRCCHRLIEELPSTDVITRAPERTTCRSVR